MQTIQRQEVKQLLDTDTPIINVLSNEAFMERHIPGSVNIPFNEDGFVEAVEEHVGGVESTVIVYCAGPSCDASEHAAEALSDAGFADVRDYADGMEDWEAAGEPIDRNRPATEQV